RAAPTTSRTRAPASPARPRRSSPATATPPPTRPTRPTSMMPGTGWRARPPGRRSWPTPTTPGTAPSRKRAAARSPARLRGRLQAALRRRDRHAAGRVSDHGLAVARGRLVNELADAVFPPKSNAAHERLANHLWGHLDQLLTFLRVPGVDATNWRAELAIRFGVILRKVWGGNRTWVGARTQAVLMSVWRTCGQQGRSALDFLSQLLRRTAVALALPP